jgi:hypothetical protein
VANKTYENVRVYGDLTSEVFFGPKGSTLPTTLATDPTAPFKAIGWLGQAGIPLNVSTDVQKFKGWQGGTTVRTKVTSTEKGFTIECLEEAPGVTELYWGHGAPTVSGAGAAQVAKIDLPEGIGTIERACIVKFVDGDIQKWLCCTNVQVTDRQEIPHSNDEMTVYRFGLEIIGASYLLTNAPAYLPEA